jgi:hypothetical protein
MSKPRPGDDYAKFKDLLRGVTPQQEHLNKGKKKHPKKTWIIFAKDWDIINGQFTYIDKWVSGRKFALKEDAEQWVEKQQRRHSSNSEQIYRIEKLE